MTHGNGKTVFNPIRIAVVVWSSMHSRTLSGTLLQET